MTAFARADDDEEVMIHSMRLFASEQQQQQQQQQETETDKSRLSAPTAELEIDGFCEKSIIKCLNQQPSQAPDSTGMRKQILLLALSLSCLLASGSQASANVLHHATITTTIIPTHKETSTTLAAASNKSIEQNDISSSSSSSLDRVKIPGLYDERENPWIKPLQGQLSFERLIYNGSQQQQQDGHRQQHLISLIQYYMATCPDCQGFSPYFKRFVRDVGPHWRHLVRIHTINCNDEININLCWQQNPNLIVPLVRWYTFPEILSDQQLQNSNRTFKDYPTDLLNVAHRSYIKKQRRDLISLRHATLRYIESVLDQLSQSSREFYSKLPLNYKLLLPISSSSSTLKEDAKESTKFLDGIADRTKQCLEQAKEAKRNLTELDIVNYIVFEKPGSYVGKTFVADWSNWTCATEYDRTNRLFLFHYSDNLNLVSELKVVQDLTRIRRSENDNMKPIHMDPRSANERQPLLMQLNTNSSMISADTLETIDKFTFNLLASNHSASRSKRHAVGQSGNKNSDPLHNLSLEKYYASRRFRYPMEANHGINKVSPQQQSSTSGTNNIVKKRLRRSSSSSSLMQDTNNNKTIDYNELENINWGPEYIYPGEEAIRYGFNLRVWRSVSLTYQLLEEANMPGAELKGENPGEILRSNSRNGSVAIPSKEDDLTLLRLTDYYKVLDEIMHKNILSRAEIDGYRLVATTCFIRHLSKHFPFQGQQSHQQKSIARHYLELLYQKYSDILGRELGSGKQGFHGCSGNLLKDQREALEKLKVNTKELQDIQNQTREDFDVGLPSEKHFKWQYCAGSSEYLRGHTCSLWILFHTLTVHEYLNRDHRTAIVHNLNCTMQQSNKDLSSAEEYKFMIKYSESKEKCDPTNPEPALVSAKTSELFEEPLHFVLSNIINFVRYYLSCTNCAAHFSCMVKNSPGLNLCNPRPDDHILWLWEAHNRVNVRTKSTHSEDPNRPKHVFPVYDACPECYLERPISNQTSFEQMKFNRKALVEFIVGRYRKSALINNKIKIEDLFRKSPTPAPVRLNTATTSLQPQRRSQNDTKEAAQLSRLSDKLTTLVM